MSTLLTVKYKKGVSPNEAINNEIIQKILARKKDVEKSIKMIKEKLSNNSGKVYSDHMVDCSDDQREHTQASQNLPALESELRRIKKALKRLAEGMYGLCQDCNQAIPLARLQALDWTPCRCIQCQEKHDQR